VKILFDGVRTDVRDSVNDGPGRTQTADYGPRAARVDAFMSVGIYGSINHDVYDARECCLCGRFRPCAASPSCSQARMWAGLPSRKPSPG